jgi:hypothetical protein
MLLQQLDLHCAISAFDSVQWSMVVPEMNGVARDSAGNQNTESNFKLASALDGRSVHTSPCASMAAQQVSCTISSISILASIAYKGVPVNVRSRNDVVEKLLEVIHILAKGYLQPLVIENQI